jgi:hypothetical protein
MARKSRPHRYVLKSWEYITLLHSLPSKTACVSAARITITISIAAVQESDGLDK